jgi:2-dehydro-3-deoxyphosphogluconate aldolase/(4S)-4-hydroxy-2-oxoglutarate aldolase
MPSKNEILTRILNCGVVSIARSQDSSWIPEAARAAKAGGIDVFEVTMSVPGALDVLRNLSRHADPDILLGAGTVLDSETARAAILTGAEFIVTPTLNPDVITMALRYGKVVIPGAFTPTEFLTAWEAGADLVKVFPAGTLGPKYIKDVLGPLGQVLLLPTGGITLDNAADYIRAGAVGVGMTALFDKDLIANGRYDEITRRAQSLKDSIRKAKT